MAPHVWCYLHLPHLPAQQCLAQLCLYSLQVGYDVLLSGSHLALITIEGHVPGLRVLRERQCHTHGRILLQLPDSVPPRADHVAPPAWCHR